MMIHNQRQRISRLRFIIGMIVLIFFIGGIAVFLVKKFKLEHIEVVGDGMKLEINERLLMGNTLFFPSESIRLQLLSTYPELLDVVVQKKVPNTVVIIPTLRVPIAELITKTAAFIVDQDGVVIGPSHGVTLPQIAIDVPYIRLGGNIKDKKVIAALEFLKYSKDTVLVKTITNPDGKTLLAKTEQLDVLFSEDNDREEVVRSLQLLLSGFRIKGTMPKVIDLRFTKLIVQW